MRVRNKFELEITICKWENLVHFSFLFCMISVLKRPSEVLNVKSPCKLQRPMLVIYFIGILLPAVFNKAFGSHMDNNLFQSHVGYYLLPMIFYFMNNL